MLKQMGKRLQQARVARGLTQAELGALVGLPQSHISKIERGETDFQWSTGLTRRDPPHCAADRGGRA